MREGHTERLEAALAGRYRIERKLGEGGMASVYLAEDLKHKRNVALKILRPELAAVIGAERFLAEIQTTANLQHPHILPLFDSGEAQGYLYYVMPYIDGETLRDKLDREKQLGVEESVRIARDVADALDYAHRQGVIHRDIKPGNILLHDGRPVVADFGIALAVSAAGGGRMTETGLSLGTPHYMSPEQASADRDLSARSDVYSLGCVLYEMLAGQPPHTGPSAQSILVHILTEDAKPLTALRHTVPANVAAAVAKSIEKLPADRFETAKAFREALDDPAFTYAARPRTPGTGIATPAVSYPLPSRAWLRDRRSLAALTAVIVLTIVTAVQVMRPADEATQAGPVRFTIQPQGEAQLTLNGAYPDVAIAPRGDFIVYKGPGSNNSPTQLYLRPLADLSANALRGTDGGLSPAISPDGEWVAFTRAGEQSTLYKVSTLGGVRMKLTEAEDFLVGIDWGERDDIVFGVRSGSLFRVSASGGASEPLTTLGAGDASHGWPSVIEGRNAVLFVIVPSGGTPSEEGQIAVLDLTSREVTRLDVRGVSPRYVPTGHIVYAVEDGSVRAVPFDAESLAITGGATPLIEGIGVKQTGAAEFDVSADGSLVYALGQANALTLPRSLLWVARDGAEDSIPADLHGYVYPRISPDGRRVALDARDEDAGIWMWDFAAGTLSRMTLGAVEGEWNYPAWSPDGSRVAYVAGGDRSIYWKAANNTGTPEVLLETPGSEGADVPNPYFFTPDGSGLVIRDQSNPETDDDLLLATLGGDPVITPLLTEPYRELNAELSPNGRWMAYQSNEAGRWEVYVRPFPDVQGDKVLVSNDGGRYPAWGPDGRELFYLEGEAGVGGRLISVSVDDGSSVGAFTLDGRSAVLDWPYFDVPEGRPYDVSPDGSRFLVLRNQAETGGAGSPEIQVVLNWFEELTEQLGSD